MFILKGKALCKLMFKAICVLETCALIQEGYLNVCNVSVVVIVHGDSPWMMEWVSLVAIIYAFEYFCVQK